ncbi:ATPase [Burkholderia latens]|uniref:ATPase n=1 Tax=Burkholderia latens TaxID=488446 RepID=A0A6P2GK28_9BURK|nr:ATPase [Burkholderia latens]
MEVDSDATELSVELRPVDNELMPVEVDVDSELIELLADERPVDVEVDSDATELLVELSPVDNEPMPVESDEIALLDDDTVVDSEFTAELVAKSWEPLIASVLVAVI